MNRKGLVLTLALAPVFILGVDSAVFAGAVSGFDCVVDLPDKLVTKNPTGLGSDTVDKTSKITSTSTMSCDTLGEIDITCKVPLTADEIKKMGGVSKTIYTYNGITKCTVDRSICANGPAKLKTTKNSQLVIRQTDDFTAKTASLDKKWVAKVSCEAHNNDKPE
ncbi:hypothetical protein [Methyloterricola oryzae]|uniref:hypothetical protein n=1 Tax=Methyloterricola oryzae TaxID=1495050 RepID=UPI0005EB08A1|nr:hypothetical protein [Methyloterricola oryzae]